MGEDRGKKQNRLALVNAVRGHDNTIVHSFLHTGGECPKCGCKELHTRYCKFGEVPAVRRCELEDEHLHRICGACKYPWVERTLDHAMLAEEKGEVASESELQCVLVAVALQVGGICLNRALVTTCRGWRLQFSRDIELDQITVLPLEPEPAKGDVSNPRGPEDMVQEGG